ncbi:hypothetical protein HQ533_03640 [Candidatus Woesearchaeota archaeon]|nr:hypothetical protein [Candidatus Woesearchaeota archaeon]
MYELINFAVELMEKENYQNPELLPSQNPEINPTQNPDINCDQNISINSSQNPTINPTQTPNWRQNQWNLFKQTVLWDKLNDRQKKLCQHFLQNL